MKLIIMLLTLIPLLGIGLLLVLLADLDKAESGEKSEFWEKKEK